MSDPRPTPPNRLLIPLISVSIVCLIEAVVIAFLLGRGRTAPVAAAPFPTAAQPVTAPAPPTPSGSTAPHPTQVQNPAVTRGKLGQRVTAAGLAMTVVRVSHEPRFKEVLAPPPTQKFVDLELLIENDSPRAFQYFSNQFTLKDAADRRHASTGLGAGDPALSWGTIVPGEKVRGHVAFVLPRDATGLALTYPVSDAPSSPAAIHIDLGP